MEYVYFDGKNLNPIREDDPRIIRGRLLDNLSQVRLETGELLTGQRNGTWKDEQGNRWAEVTYDIEDDYYEIYETIGVGFVRISD